MKKILIIGAGISGLYLANLLEKNGNYNYKILEKKKSFNLNQGYGIQLSVNGVKLLNKIGFKNTALHDVNYPKNIKFYNAENCKLISQIDISKYNDYNNYYTTLKRSVLFNFLLNKIPQEKIIFGVNIESIDQDDSFKINIKNSEPEQSNFLVICDGVFSKSREMVLNTNNNTEFYNSIAIRGNLKRLESNDVSLYLGPNFHFVTYPINQDEESNFISIIRERNLEKIKTEDKNKLISEYVSFLSKKSIYNLKNNLENLSLYPIYVSNKFNIPKNKKVFLSGDALYAFPPSFAQGASQSIESSYEVFKNLEGINSNYYKKREMKIKQISSRSKLNHFAFHVSNPLTILARDFAFKYFTKKKLFLESYLGKIYR